MRLPLALAAAALLHGALFGAALALLPRTAARTPASPIAVDVDVVPAVPAQPDPVAPAPGHPEPHAGAPAFGHPRARSHAPRVATSAPPSAVVAVAEPAVPAATDAAAAASAQAAPASAGGAALVSAQPRYRSNPPPVYPIACRRRREEGVVLVKVAVGADGVATTLTVERSCGHPLLDQAALDAVRRWTFEPARAAGLPVASLVVIPVRFSLADADR